MPRLAASLLAGVLFGVGLGVARMSDPAKVQAFLDVAGAWDASLAFVMLGAVSVAFVGFRWVMRRGQPLWDTRFHLPASRAIDSQLLSGAALFGIGWGLTGYCPGPALSTLLTGNQEVWWFVPSMLAGAWLQRAWARHRQRP
ncbi:MAG: hypothetical protein QM749_08470 [Aquabacterium sp.]